MQLTKEKIREIPTSALSVIGLIQMGIDPLDKMTRQTLTKHRQLLKAYGYDIDPMLSKLRTS